MGVRVCVRAYHSQRALSVMLPTDQQFWKHRSGLALREEDEAFECVGVRGGWYLTSQCEKRVSPAARVCVSEFVPGLG